MTYALLLAGGHGERFWPRSRLKEPKQFLRLEGKKSLIQLTAERLGGAIPRNRVYVVSLASQRRRIRQELPFLKASQIIGEPTGKNTAAAITLGTARILKTDPSATICVFPCDQWIRDRRAFHGCLRQAIRRAEEGRSIVLFGVRPTRPEIGYGYIEVGPDGSARRFIEKPTFARAKRLLRSKGIFWNSGMFVFRGSFLMRALKKTYPRLLKLFSSLTDGSLRRFYATLPSVSFDAGVLERLSRIECIRVGFGWDDVGSWLTLARRLVPDQEGNQKVGIAFAVDATRNLIVSDHKHLVGLFGVSDLAVIRTEEATLVCPKSNLNQLKVFLEQLKRSRKFRPYL